MNNLDGIVSIRLPILALRLNILGGSNARGPPAVHFHSIVKVPIELQVDSDTTLVFRLNRLMPLGAVPLKLQDHAIALGRLVSFDLIELVVLCDVRVDFFPLVGLEVRY